MSEPFWSDPEGGVETFIPFVGEATLWDTALLGGRRVPGVVTVTAKTARKIDVKTSPGTDGATITDQGYEPAKPVIEVLTWTGEQWIDLQALLDYVAPKPGKGFKKPPPALSLVHPGANAIGVSQVYVTSVSTNDAASPLGARKTTIECIQYLTPKKAVIGPPPVFDIPTVAPVEPPTAPASPGSGTPQP